MKKGTSGIFVVWSILGIILAIFVTIKGFRGEGLSATFTFFLGLFFIIKEIADIFH